MVAVARLQCRIMELLAIVLRTEAQLWPSLRLLNPILGVSLRYFQRGQTEIRVMLQRLNDQWRQITIRGKLLQELPFLRR